MNREDLINLFSQYPVTEPLSGVVQVAIERLQTYKYVRVVSGEYQTCEDLLHIYEGRLYRSQKRGAKIPGLAETVDIFRNSKGILCGGYADTEDGFIYFWTDDNESLVGCVLKPTDPNI